MRGRDGDPACRHGYLQFLTQREFLPVFWPQGLLQLAKETSLNASKASADLQAMEEDFREHVAPAVARHPDRCIPERMTLDSFMVASSWVSSRAFHVDDYHGAHFTLASAYGVHAGSAHFSRMALSALSRHCIMVAFAAACSFSTHDNVLHTMRRSVNGAAGGRI